MTDEEIRKEVASAVGAALTPIIETMGTMTGAIEHLYKNKPEASKGAENEEPENGNGVSAEVQAWIKDKATDRLGGKDLFGKSPHNPNPKPQSEGKTI